LRKKRIIGKSYEISLFRADIHINYTTEKLRGRKKLVGKGEKAPNGTGGE